LKVSQPSLRPEYDCGWRGPIEIELELRLGLSVELRSFERAELNGIEIVRKNGSALMETLGFIYCTKPSNKPFFRVEVYHRKHIEPIQQALDEFWHGKYRVELGDQKCRT